MGDRSVETSRAGRSVSRLARRQALALSLAGLVLLVVCAAALAWTGALRQPAGTAGCISETGAGPCVDGHGIDDPGGVAVSPDGKSVYVSSFNSSAVVRLNRNPTTGAISEPAGTAGCISETGAGPCADGHGLKYADRLAVSPDGKSVYVTSGSAVVRLNRNTTTGAISQPGGTAGCISWNGAGPCVDGHGISDPGGVAVSPDGKSVYVADRGSVVRLNRNTTTGAISQPAGAAGCVSDTGAGPCADGHGLYYPIAVAVSPDGKNVYATSVGNVDLFKSDSVARFNRNPTTGAISEPAGTAGCVSEDGLGPCADGHNIDAPFAVAVSPDGRNVYVASVNGNAVVRLNRNTTTGAISQPAAPAGAVGVSGPEDLAVSPDGKDVYIASYPDAAVRLNRNTTTGAISKPAGTAGCISETGAAPCADGHALEFPDGVAVSPNGRSVYVVSFDSDAVARFNRAP